MADGRGETIIFLERDKFYVDAGGAISSVNFPPNVCLDLDVKNREALLGLVNTFVRTSKIEPSQIFFVISEAACFSKDFPIKKPEEVAKVETDSQTFIDAVPFNSVLSKVYKTETVYRVVATNQELVDTIVDGFTSEGFGLTAVVPANIYPEYGAARELTQDFSKHILDTQEKAKTSSMIGGEKVVQEDHEVTISTTKPSKSKLLPYLLAGFGILLVILVLVVVFRK